MHDIAIALAFVGMLVLPSFVALHSMSDGRNRHMGSRYLRSLLLRD